MKIDGEKLQELCPRPESLGAGVGGKLISKEQALIESHLVKCNHCRRLIELATESESEALT
jgi:predicted anti-sigma-YlaC factor YlaD